jgi:hypothetical protein
MTQSELARRVGITQGAIGALIGGRARASIHLHKVAEHLQTTIAYIEGETANPDANAPPPMAVGSYQAVKVQVLLPGERALAEMFEGLLRSMDLSAPVDEQALLLAKAITLLAVAAARYASPTRDRPVSHPQPSLQILPR